MPTAMYSAEDAASFDIDWFAADRLGKIGQFTTGGAVWPPLPARADKPSNEALLAYVDALPPRSAAELPGLELQYGSAFAAIASHGVFAFDIFVREQDHAIYRCVAAPLDESITMEQLAAGTNLTPILATCFDSVFALGSLIRVSSDGKSLESAK